MKPFQALLRSPSSAIFHSSSRSARTSSSPALPLTHSPAIFHPLNSTIHRLISTANSALQEEHQNQSSRLPELDKNAQDSEEFLRPKLHCGSQIDHDGRVAGSSEYEEEAGQPIAHHDPHPLEDEIVAEGFNHEYRNPQDIITPTLQTLQQFASEWTATEYLAPCTTLIAPSINGKSRLLKELSTRTCVVYICLRPQEDLMSSAYPPRSEYAASVLLDSTSTTLQARYEDLLLAILHTVADYFSTQEPGTTTEERLSRWILHSFPQSHRRSGDPPFWTDVKTKMTEISAIMAPLTAAKKDAQFSKALRRMKDSTDFIEQNDLRLLLAIDQASELLASSSSPHLSFLSIFRDALQMIPSPSSGFFSILADSNSRLSTFNPTSPYDPNHRIGRHKHKKLFPPIYEIDTFDVNVPTDPPADWHQLQSASRVLSYGSPFWGAYADAAKKKGVADDEIVKGLTQYALQKLLCTNGQSVPTAASLTNPQVFALLGSTIQPGMYGAPHLDATLVSSHAAQCIHIDPSELILTSRYPSQFTFSSAANQYLASDEARLIRCIQVLASLNRQRLVGVGDVGRLVSRIILLRAMQVTMQNTPPVADGLEPDSERLSMPFGHSVRLVDFLKTLTGRDEEPLELGSIDTENREKLLNEGHVFWNHFISTDRKPTSAALLTQLYRGLAVNCGPNQPGFEHLFTIYLRSTPTAALDEKGVTFGGVRVTNLSENEHLARASYQCTPAHAGIELQEPNPYLVLNFSLNDHRPKNPKAAASINPTSTSSPSSPDILPIPDGNASKQELRRRASLAFYGLKAFPFLTQHLINALQELLDSDSSGPWLHTSKDSSARSQKYIKLVSPEVFSSSN